MSNWCSTHPCDYGRGGKVCMNCGADKPLTAASNPLDIVDAGRSAQNWIPPTIVAEPGLVASKATNPKDAIGATKLPMSWVPTAVTRYAALAFTEGALKYGRYNWRASGVRMSIYLDALHRHLSKLQDGEWCDGDHLGLDADGNPQGTQVPHLASIIACAGIILDAWECDKITDDRPPPNDNTASDMDSRVEHVAYLKKLFAGYTPHHHVITDPKT